MTDEESTKPTEPDDDPELDAAIRALTPEEQDALDRHERRIWFWLTVGGAIVLVLFMLGFWPVMQGRLTAAKQLDDAAALVDQAGGTIAGIDKAVSAQLGPEAAATAPNIAPELLVARRELNQASALLKDAMPHLTEDEQHRGDLATAVIKARVAMIDNAPVILSASSKAVRAKTLGDRGWAYTLKASATESRAVDAYRLQTASAVETASVAVPVIQSELASARLLYSQATTAFPAAGFARYKSYVDLRKTAIAQLGTAAKLWLGGNQPLAKITFAAYKVSATKADAARAKLPYAPGNATGEAFKKLAGKALDAYTRAKLQAAEAEKALKTP